MSCYWDIDACLSEETRVPGIFTVDAVNLGYLDPSTEDEDLEAGTKVELPFWLLTALAARNMVAVESPSFYGPKFRSELLADPSVLDIRSRCPFFYNLGVAATAIFADDELLPSLMKCLVARYRKILDTSQNSHNEDTSKFTRNLTHLELELYRAGYRGAEQYFRWKNRQCERLAVSSVIADRPRKRRRR